MPRKPSSQERDVLIKKNAVATLYKIYEQTQEQESSVYKCGSVGKHEHKNIN